MNSVMERGIEDAVGISATTALLQQKPNMWSGGVQQPKLTLTKPSQGQETIWFSCHNNGGKHPFQPPSHITDTHTE